MNQILYALWTICPGLPHHFDTAHRELLGSMRTFSCSNIGTEEDITSLEHIMCCGNENIIGQNYKARLECGVEIISLKFT